jgi:hypothetical protein
MSEQLTERLLKQFAYLSSTNDKALAMLKGSQKYEVYKALTGDVNPVARKHLEKLADHAAKSLKKNLVESQLRAIGKVLSQGLEEGLNPRAVAPRLKMVQQLDSVRAGQLLKYAASVKGDKNADKKIDGMRKRLLAARRRVIADTESNAAVSLARDTEARQQGKKFKQWMTTNNDRVCDICHGNQSQGPIPIDKPFQSGHMMPPGHPGICRCALAYVKSARAVKVLKAINSERSEE